MGFTHLVLRVDDPVGDLVSGKVQDAITSKICGGWAIGVDGFIHIHMDTDVDWDHQLSERVTDHYSAQMEAAGHAQPIIKRLQPKIDQESGVIKWS